MSDLRVWRLYKCCKLVGVNAVFSLCLFLCCLYIAWFALSQFNFGYAVWYNQLDIDYTIQKHVPLNRYGKQSFVTTDKAEHVRLFAEIVKSINNAGRGLEDIAYQTQGATKSLLLTPAEVLHLQDVANLLTTLKKAIVLAGFIGFICLLMFYLQLVPLMKSSMHIFYMLAVVVFTVVLVLLLGAEKVFYWAHVHIFPENHQWFFYYQESIMSMLMKAPLLFAPIACELLGLTMILWLFGLYAVNFYYDQYHNRNK